MSKTHKISHTLCIRTRNILGITTNKISNQSVAITLFMNFFPPNCLKKNCKLLTLYNKKISGRQLLVGNIVFYTHNFMYALFRYTFLYLKTDIIYQKFFFTNIYAMFPFSYPKVFDLKISLKSTNTSWLTCFISLFSL